MFWYRFSKSRFNQLIATGILAGLSQAATAADFVLKDNQITWLGKDSMSATVRANGVSSQVDLSDQAPLGAIPDISFGIENVEELNTSGSSDLRLFVEVNNRLDGEELEIRLGVIRVITKNEQVASVKYINDQTDDGYESILALGRMTTDGIAQDFSDNFDNIPNLVSTSDNRVNIAVSNLFSTVSGDSTFDPLIAALAQSESLKFTVGVKSSGGIPSIFGTFYNNSFLPTNIAPSIDLGNGTLAQEFTGANFFQGATLLFKDMPTERVVDKYQLDALDSNNDFYETAIENEIDAGNSLDVGMLSSIEVLMGEAGEITADLLEATENTEIKIDIDQALDALLAISHTTTLGGKVSNAVAQASTNNIAATTTTLLNQSASILQSLADQQKQATGSFSNNQSEITSDFMGNLATATERLANRIIPSSSDLRQAAFEELRAIIQSIVTASNDLMVPLDRQAMNQFARASRSLAGNAATFVAENIANQSALPLSNYERVNADYYSRHLSPGAANVIVSLLQYSGGLNKTSVTLNEAPVETASVSSLVDSSYNASHARYAFNSGDNTFSMRPLSVKAIPKGMDAGTTTLMDGRLVVISEDGYAIEMAPTPANLLEFTRAVETLGIVPVFRNDGSFELPLSVSESFSGTFAYDNLTEANMNSRCGLASFGVPTEGPQHPDAAFSMTCNDSGITQRIVPFASQPAFYETLRLLNLDVNTDRNTGVITVAGIGQFKPAFYVSEERTQAEIDSFEANKGDFNLVLETADYNNDGLIDIKVIDSTSVQLMYGVPALP